MGGSFDARQRDVYSIVLDSQQAAIDALNGTELGDREIKVNVARPREERGNRPRGQRRDDRRR